MADEEKAIGGIPGPMQQFAAQMRRMTADLEKLTGVGVPIPPWVAMPSKPGVLLPGALSAQQLKSTATTIAAQRKSIQALRAQLAAFDQQLGALEGILGPLVEWSRLLH